MIEIRVVPSDIRSRVRCVVLDRGRTIAALLVLSFVLASVIGSMTAAPTIIRRVYKENYLGLMRHERDIQHARLKENVTQMASLQQDLEEQRIRVEKLIAVYGLERTLGAGGFSIPAGTKSAAVDLPDARRRQGALNASMKRLQRQLDLLVRYEHENAEVVRHTPSILPLPADQFVVTAPFGMRISPFTRAADFHNGLDLSAPAGTPIYAAADGVVTFAGVVPLRASVSWWRLGKVIVIEHNERFLTIYGHCDGVEVGQGQSVRQGQKIGTVGSTGWSTNPHLHYEVRSNLEEPGTFVAVDPRIYILNYQWRDEAALLTKRGSAQTRAKSDEIPGAFLPRR